MKLLMYKILDFVQPCHQEFMAFCETMELVPAEELDSSAQGRSSTFADQRAKKVYLDIQCRTEARTVVFCINLNYVSSDSALQTSESC